MKSLSRIRIQVPGTSANLGPGFDVLGMAMKIYNRFVFDFGPDLEYKASYTDGSPLPFSESEDLVFSSYKEYFRIFLNSVGFPEYHCKMDLDLPLKGGLGSSASAVVAGFLLAREVHRNLYPQIPIPTEGRFLYELAMQEGHPDNTSPAYLGGFVLSYFDSPGHLSYYKKKFPNSVAIYAFIPKCEVATHESRKILPSSYSPEDLIFNMTRIATWIQFFETRRFSDLRLALQDRMHTPYRLPKIQELQNILPSLERKGLGYCLSGSGPTLLVFMERKRVSQIEKSLRQELENVFPGDPDGFIFRRLNTDHTGAKVSLL
jgi:homoserine kinase